MNLVVFPGGTDPNHNEEKVIYDLIKENALDKGFSEVEIATYLGHYSHHERGKLSIKSAAETITKKLQELESHKSEYIVVVRSFGCYPFLEAIKKLDLEYCKKATLWGAPPYYLYFYYLNECWDKIKKNGESQHYSTTNYFKELIPIEVSIEHHLKEKELNFNLIITSGELDKTFPEHHRDTLSSLNSNPNILFPERIKGLEHKVRGNNKTYLDLLLNYEE